MKNISIGKIRGLQQITGKDGIFTNEIAEIAFINPLYPPILGDFLIWGAPPDPRQEESCTSFSAVY
jgi:hypothetical protein